MFIALGCDADPTMGRLSRRIEGAGPSDPDAAVCSGSGAVTPDGRLQLLGNRFSAALLADLAGWVKAHVSNHPGLARLRGVELVMVTPNRRVRQIFSDDTLWQGVPAPPCPGTLRASSDHIQAMGTGDNALFWMTAHGDEDSPFIGVHPFQGDPDMGAFTEQLRRYRRRFPRASDAIQGVVRRQPSGQLLFSTQKDVTSGQWRTILKALVKVCPELREFAQSRFVQVQQGKITQAALARRSPKGK